MKRNYYGKRITGERFQRYSLRKLSVGLVSATIRLLLSTAIAGNVSTIEAAEVSARQTIPVQYHYVVSLNWLRLKRMRLLRSFKICRRKLWRLLFSISSKNSGLLENNLPRTGYSSLWEATFAVAGLTLAVIVIARGRNGKRYLSSILLVTGLGSILLAPSVFAVTNIELACHNQRLNLTVGDKRLNL